MPAVDLTLTGLAVDLPPYHYPPDVWTDGQNVEMSDGFPRRARGFGRVFGDTLFTPRFLVNTRQAAVSLWVYGGDQAIAVTDGGPHVDITGALAFNSTGVPSPWSGGVMNQRAILNNLAGTDPGYWVPGSPAVLRLPDWPVDRRAKSIRVFREYLIAMNLTDGAVADPDLFAWSDVAPPNNVPQSWTPGPQSQAGSASASFTPGELVDGIALRDQFFLAKQHAIYILELIGGRFVMRQRPLFSTFGMLSRNCAVEFRGQILMLTDGDVVLTNGVDAQSVIDRRVRAAIFQGLSTTHFENSFLALDKAKSEIWVCVPTEGSTYPNRAAVWSISDNKWGVRDLGANTWPHGIEGVVSTGLAEPTWATRTTEWDTDGSRWSDTGSAPSQETLTFADAGDLIQAVDELDSFDGVDPVARLQRLGLDFGEPDRYKYVSRVWPKIDGVDGSVVRLRIGGQAYGEGPVTWDEWRDVIIGTTEVVGVNARGRLIAVEIESDTSATWRAPSLTVQVELQGKF